MLREYITRGGRVMRCGYTTGSCAAGATQAAVRMLLTGKRVETVTLDTPKGVRLTLDVLNAECDGERARCAIRKDSGDDPDITGGILVYAEARRTEQGIVIDGGEGVGRVTREGLNQPVGAAAINDTPRRMIREQAALVCAECGYAGGVEVIISIPDGAELAKRTFNPKLGIVGGLSVLGTTGIVEPMSHAAVIDTIRLELSVLSASGEKAVLLCPGNYGETFARETLCLSTEKLVTVSNYIGDAVEAAVERGFEKILLVGHIGKLVKLGIGARNTHSAWGDGRMETLSACALESGGDLDLLRAIMNSATTDAALQKIADRGLLYETMDVLGKRIQASLEHWVTGNVEIGFICFTNAPGLQGVLTKSDNADALSQYWRK